MSAPSSCSQGVTNVFTIPESQLPWQQNRFSTCINIQLGRMSIAVVVHCSSILATFSVGFICCFESPFTRHGKGAVAIHSKVAMKMGYIDVYETIYTSMAPVPLPSTASAPLMACHAYWVLYPFFHGKNAVNGTGAVAVSCKQALTLIRYKD